MWSGAKALARHSPARDHHRYPARSRGSASLGGAAPGLRVIARLSLGTARGQLPLGLSCASGAPPGSSFACGGSAELRAWLCAFVRAFDALRCVPARRVLKLSPISGFHLYDRLHAQQFYSYYFLQKGK